MIATRSSQTSWRSARNSEPRSCRLCWWGPHVHREGPGDPRLVHIFVPTIGLWWQHRHALPPQRRLPGELAPPLLPGSVSIQRQDQLMHRARPVPAPALDTKNRDDAGHACSEQRQHIKSALAHPPQSGTCLARQGACREHASAGLVEDEAQRRPGWAGGIPYLWRKSCNSHADSCLADVVASGLATPAKKVSLICSMSLSSC